MGKGAWKWVDTYPQESACSECKNIIPPGVPRVYNYFQKRPACRSCAVNKLGVVEPGAVVTTTATANTAPVPIAAGAVVDLTPVLNMLDYKFESLRNELKLATKFERIKEGFKGKFSDLEEDYLPLCVHKNHLVIDVLRNLQIQPERWDEFMEFLQGFGLDGVEFLKRVRSEDLSNPKPMEPQKTLQELYPEKFVQKVVERERLKLPGWWQPIQEAIGDNRTPIGGAFGGGHCTVPVFEAHRMVVACRPIFSGSVERNLSKIQDAVESVTGTRPTITFYVHHDHDQPLPWAQLEGAPPEELLPV